MRYPSSYSVERGPPEEEEERRSGVCSALVGWRREWIGATAAVNEREGRGEAEEEEEPEEEERAMCVKALAVLMITA